MPIPDEPPVEPHPDPWVDDRLFGPIHLGHALLAAIDEWQLERLKEMADADPR